MDETTLGFVDPDLARRLELCHFWRSVRYTQAYQRLHPQAQTAIFDSAGGLGVYVGPGSPLNNAGGLGLSGPVSAAELDELEDFYHARGDRVRLHFCPLADPSLLDLLRSRGYTIDGFFSVLVYRIPSSFSPAPLPPGVSLTRARPEQADEWLQVVAEGFEETASPSPAAFDILGPNFHAAEFGRLLRLGGWPGRGRRWNVCGPRPARRGAGRRQHTGGLPPARCSACADRSPGGGSPSPGLRFGHGAHRAGQPFAAQPPARRFYPGLHKGDAQKIKNYFVVHAGDARISCVNHKIIPLSLSFLPKSGRF